VDTHFVLYLYEHRWAIVDDKNVKWIVLKKIKTIRTTSL